MNLNKVVSQQKILGCLPFGSVLNKEQSRSIMQHAWEQGMREFDVATLYGGGQAAYILGNFLKGKRSESRIWCSIGLREVPDSKGVFSVASIKQSKAMIRESIEEMLIKLDTDYIDLLNIHAPDDSTPIEETLEALESFIKKGTVKEIGYSNFDPAQLGRILDAEKFTGVKINAMQMHGNLIEQRLLNEFQGELNEKKKKIFCYRPFARGLLGRNYSRINPKPLESRATRGWRLDGYLTSDILRQIERVSLLSEKYSISPVQLSLIWLFNIRKVDGIVFGVRTIEQLREIIYPYADGNTEEIINDLLEILGDPAFSSISSTLPVYYFEK